MCCNAGRINLSNISTEGLMRVLNSLCKGVGSRFTGSEGEVKAEEIIAMEFGKRGASVSEDAFDLKIWGCKEALLSIIGPERAEVECLPVSYTGSTGGRIRGEAVFLETASPFDMAKVSAEGRIGVMAGSIGGSHAPEEGADKLRRLVSSGLKGLIMVEDRVPTSLVRAEGIPPFWFKNGTMPRVSVSFQGGLKLRGKGVEVEMLIDASTRDVKSRNIVAEVPGSGRRSEVIVVTAHHDTVPNSVGACDNASGVASLLQLAEHFSREKTERTMRLISFGAEEQLSVGATNYATRHLGADGEVVLEVNLDGVGAGIGLNEVSVIGEAGLRDYVQSKLADSQYSAEVKEEVSPFSDHYPFSLHGIPSVWFRGRRPNFFFHSRLDDLDHIFVEDVAETARACAHLISSIDSSKALPFSREIPPEQWSKIGHYKKELYGLH
jgi:aminopeptidase YwaD